MRYIRMAFFAILILFLILTAIGWMFPSTVRTTRAVDIHAPFDSVYKYLDDPKYWKKWMAGADSNTITFLSTNTSGPGTLIKMGTGEVKITRESEDTIFSVWRSAGGQVLNAAFVPFIPKNQNVVTVQWYFEKSVNWYPWERLGSLSNDKVLGPVIEESLKNLKKALED